MGLKPAFLAGGAAAGVVARDTELVGVAMQETPILAAVGVVTGGAIRASRRDVWKGGGPVLLDLLRVTLTAELVLVPAELERSR